MQEDQGGTLPCLAVADPRVAHVDKMSVREFVRDLRSLHRTPPMEKRAAVHSVEEVLRAAFGDRVVALRKPRIPVSTFHARDRSRSAG